MAFLPLYVCNMIARLCVVVSFQGTLSKGITTQVTKLSDLFKLTIGRHDAPFTDQFTAQVLTSIAKKSTMKVLQVSSSPGHLQEALLSSNKMESLHTLELIHGTSQVSACPHAEHDGFHLFSLPQYIVSSNSQCYICPTIYTDYFTIS